MDDDKSRGAVKINYVSFFNSPNLYAEDVITKKRMQIAFETTVTGWLTPAFTEISSYIRSEIYFQVFACLIPIAALMTIVWIDNIYRRKIRQAYIRIS
jgi:hypothetical protein